MLQAFNRSLGKTGISVSPLGYGSVKIGRNTGVKYPSAYALPDDAQISSLLNTLQELGINLLDTAPAYGNAEEKLGAAITQRHNWVLCSKVGEIFDGNHSTYCFEPNFIKNSVNQSLQRLRTDYLDILLLHLPYATRISTVQRDDVIDTLNTLKQQGKVRAIGASTHDEDGGMAALSFADVLMMEYSPAHPHTLPVLHAAQQQGVGILVKKGLNCGNLVPPQGVTAPAYALNYILQQPAAQCTVISSLQELHLRQNAEIAAKVLRSLASKD